MSYIQPLRAYRKMISQNIKTCQHQLIPVSPMPIQASCSLAVSEHSRLHSCSWFGLGIKRCNLKQYNNHYYYKGIAAEMNQGLYFGQVVIGPAGSGKSTYCQVMQEMAETLKRNIVIFNLDPAAEYNQYRSDCDIKDLITLEDAMEQMELGPNGALLFCMEYLLQNQSWLEDRLHQLVGEDDYVLFDCPGQIEIYNDQEIFRELIKFLQNYGFSLVSMYMMDVNFIFQENKFLSGTMQALSIQITLELPSITVLTKCDLIKEKEKLDKYLDYFSVDHYESHSQPYSRVKSLYGQIRKVINSNDIVTLRPLNLKDQDSIRELLFQADNSIQYGQNLEPKDKDYEAAQTYLNNQNV